MATAVALAAAGTAAVPSTAVADAAPGGPGLTLGTAHVAVYGPAQDFDVTVTDPPATDAYIRLDFYGSAPQEMHITDDGGHDLALSSSPDAPHAQSLTLGAADSDHNGIAGAPLTPGTIHLHLSVGYPAPVSGGSVLGSLVDGATGRTIVQTDERSDGHVFFLQSRTSGEWVSPGSIYPWVYTKNLATGDAQGVTARVQTEMYTGGPTEYASRLTVAADVIAASGYTAPQLARALHLGFSTTQGNYAAQTWTVEPDQSLSVQLPFHRVDNFGVAVQYLHLTADWGLPAGSLTGRLQTFGRDGRPYTDTETSFALTADTVPAALRAAFYGRDSAGVLWQYQASPNPAAAPGRYMSRDRVGGGWNIYSAVTPLASLTSAGTGDLVARDGDGVLWYYRGTGDQRAPFAPRTRVGAGWNTYATLAGAGDVTGDGHADLLAVDHDGVLWLYPGTGSSTAPFAARVRIGTGWNAYRQITGVGDMTGDGHADLLAVDHDGKLWLYQGTGSATAPYRPRVQAGTGWGGYDRVVGVGDMTGDGHPDLLARDTAGRLWYYRGTGNPAAPYAPRVQSGTGWGVYSTLF